MKAIPYGAFVRGMGFALLALLSIGPLGCHKEYSSPVEDTRPGHLTLIVNVPCATVSAATVFLDGRAVGQMAIPGSFYIDVPVGSHTFQIGPDSPVVHFHVDHGEDPTFSNAFTCPQTPP